MMNDVDSFFIPLLLNIMANIAFDDFMSRGKTQKSNIFQLFFSIFCKKISFYLMNNKKRRLLLQAPEV